MPYTDIPGQQVNTFEELAGAVRASLEAEPDQKAMTRVQFLDTYMSACDGNSTQRIADWMIYG